MRPSSRRRRRTCLRSPDIGADLGLRTPEVDARLHGTAIDLLELGRIEVQPLYGGDGVLQLLDRARPDDDGGHPRITQDPRHGELSERLAATCGQVVEAPESLAV